MTQRPRGCQRKDRGGVTAPGRNRDPGTAILIAGIVACLVPAMKAVKLDVTAALRTE